MQECSLLNCRKFNRTNFDKCFIVFFRLSFMTCSVTLAYLVSVCYVFKILGLNSVPVVRLKKKEAALMHPNVSNTQWSAFERSVTYATTTAIPWAAPLATAPLLRPRSPRQLVVVFGNKKKGHTTKATVQYLWIRPLFAGVFTWRWRKFLYRPVGELLLLPTLRSITIGALPRQIFTWEQITKKDLWGRFNSFIRDERRKPKCFDGFIGGVVYFFRIYGNDSRKTLSTEPAAISEPACVSSLPCVRSRIWPISLTSIDLRGV